MEIWAKLDRIGGINGSGVYFYQLRKVLRTEYISWWKIEQTASDGEKLPFPTPKLIDKDEPITLYGYSYIGLKFNVEQKYWKFAKCVGYRSSDDDDDEIRTYGVFSPLPVSVDEGTDHLSVYRCIWSSTKMFMKVMEQITLERFLEVERLQYEEKPETKKKEPPFLAKLIIEQGKINEIRWEAYPKELIIDE